MKLVSILLLCLAAQHISTTAQASRFIPVDAFIKENTKGLIVIVRDEDHEVTDASVWIENESGLIAKMNSAVNGIYHFDTIDANKIEKGLTVTVHAAGHSAVTYAESVGNVVHVDLPKIVPDSYPIIHGKLTGFHKEPSGERALVGMVAKALGISDLGQLDSSAFVSPINDEIPVYGKRDIPSNLVLPDQWFRYTVVPIHVNKPNYRLPVLAGTSNRYFAMTGDVDVGEAVSALKNNVSEKMIDLLNVTRVGITPPIRIDNKDLKDINVVSDKILNATVKLQLEKEGAPTDQHLVASLWEPEHGVFVPTDVKMCGAKAITLKLLKGEKMRVMDLVHSEKGEKFRGEWLDINKGRIPNSKLTAELSMDKTKVFQDSWSVQSLGSHNLMISRVARTYKTSVGGYRMDDTWVMITPFTTRVTFPKAALADLEPVLGKVTTASVDLLDTRVGGYPLVQGEAAADGLHSVEKVMVEIK